MLYFSPSKIIAVIAACLAALIFASPNFFDKTVVDAWPDWLPKNQLKLGLDLRGGAHLLLTMDTKELRQNMLENMREDVRAKLRENKIGTVGTGLTKDGVRVRIGRPSDMPAALKALGELSEPLSNNFITGYGAGLRLLIPIVGMARIDVGFGEHALHRIYLHLGSFEKATMARRRVR